MFLGLVLILVLLLSGCTSKEVVCNKPYILVGTDCCLDQNDNFICDSDEESKLVVEQTNKAVSRPEQTEEFLGKLYTQCLNELDLLYETYNSSMYKFIAICDGGVDFCFGQVDELLNQLGDESPLLSALCSSLSGELLDKAQYTDVDLEDLYEELSKELSTKAQEGRLRLMNLYEKLPSTELLTTYNVVRVIDGDTIAIDTGESIRLIGINAPEAGEECYDEAKGFLQFFLSDKEITLKTDIEDKDKYGRLLRYVFADGHNVNYGMIFSGLAYEYEYGLNTEYSSWFKEAELNASSENRGCLWENVGEGDIICSSNYYNCADFSTQAEAQIVMEFCGSDDIHYLDGDDDGLACETLP